MKAGNNLKILETHIGQLSQGCKLCFKGQKLLLFVTGICPRKCIYCPLSKAKKNKDVVHANELKSRNINLIIREAKLSKAKGAGITGGDPLAVINRTCKYIKALKKHFGKGFHIHLYTSLELLNEKNITKLQKSGLDELRLHPDIFNKKLWPRIYLAKGKFKELGIEIPAIPGKEKQILALINYAKDIVDFFNLNELEYATLYEKEYKKQRWKVKENYSVKGSEQTALNILKKVKKTICQKTKKIRIHYCSAKFKDAVQFTNRIKQRAKNVALPIDKITKDNMLLRGAIYTSRLKLNSLIIRLRAKYPNSMFIKDNKNSRILFNYKLANRIAKSFLRVAITEQYPTIDALEVYKEFLS